MNKTTLKRYKTFARKNFNGSAALFEACWRQYITYLNGAIDDPRNQGDVDSWLDTIASEKVNNSRSRFYIHGNNPRRKKYRVRKNYKKYAKRTKVSRRRKGRRS